MKKIINAATDVIEEYIKGLVGGSPHLARLEGWPVVVRSPQTRKEETDTKVAVISGGGSGHEPAHAGYVGSGMLDAAVLGEVFTSPSVDSVYAAIKATATDAGTFLVVKNYTGDRLNFGLAAQKARAEGHRVELVIVADDTALGDASGAGRRGLTGTVLVHKLAGAAAERGWDLDRIVETVESFLPGVGTMGVALDSCLVPGASAPSFELGADEVEWGLGIHGEPGKERGPVRSSREIADRLVGTVAEERQLSSGTPVAVLVNGLGGTPDLELRILLGDVLDIVADRGLQVRLALTGGLLTSLEMPGASVTLARVGDEHVSLLTDPARVIGYPDRLGELDGDHPVLLPAPSVEEAAPASGRTSESVARMHEVMTDLCETLVGVEEELTGLDREVGDGDLGVNLARGARAVIDAESLLGYEYEHAYLRAVSEIVRRTIGGTSGPLYSLVILGVAEKLERSENVPELADWAAGAAHGTDLIRELGGAEPGDSTMVDALAPAAEALGSAAASGSTPAEATEAMAVAARQGAEETGDIQPTLGRSSYVGARAVGHRDPGAVAIALLAERLAELVVARSGPNE